MIRLAKEPNGIATLYRDDATGLAWVQDNRTGCRYSNHPSISRTGSIKGMKQQGYWGKNDRIIRVNGCIYDIDILTVDAMGYGVLLKEECYCQACMERREKEEADKAIRKAWYDKGYDDGFSDGNMDIVGDLLEHKDGFTFIGIDGKHYKSVTVEVDLEGNERTQ